MDILGKMVGAPGPSSAALAETSTDAEFIAEIAPPMLVKLREDGLAKGASLSFFLIIAYGSITQLYWNSVRLDPTRYSGTIADLHVLAILPIGLVAIGLPYYFKRRNVRNEIRYRRQHGKWRWER